MPAILIAEDDKFLGIAYRAKLSKAGFEVTLTTDGDELLAALHGGVKPELILLDLVMPKKDGFTTLAELKQEAKYKDIPVIVASNLGQKEDLDKAIGLGAVDYIIKSNLSMEGLLVKINETIAAHKAKA